jgi:amino acid adenylation domain-containing protein
MVMMAACAAVLSWYTGQEDCVFGTPIAMRDRTELESMIGPLVNVLPVRLVLNDDPTFAQLLRRARDAMLAAHEHRHVPFEALVEWLKPRRESAYSPLFQIALQESMAGDAVLEAWGAPYELTWNARETSMGLECTFGYRADLFSAAGIEAIATHLETVLRRATQDSSRRVSEVTVLTSQELAQLEQFNATAIELPQALFAAQFAAVAAQHPARVALACESGELLTYGELNRRANQLAHALRDKGVSREVRVAVCLERSPLLLVALLAIQKAAGTYIPLDPRFPAERLQFMLTDSKAAVLVTRDGVAPQIELPEHLIAVDLDALPLDEQPAQDPPLAARLDDAVYVIYTSGSTGRPKGVAVSHRSLMNLLWSMAREPGLSPTDVLAAVTTISFDIAGLELYLPLLLGARIELVSLETAADGAALAALLHERAVTVLQATPATWRLLVEADWHGRTGLRALCGGEALPRDLAESLLPRVSELWNLYGPTETTIWSTAARVRNPDDITIGRPIPNTRIHVVGKSGTLQPIGIPGEIWIGGAGVALGYVERPQLTGERFVPDRFGGETGTRLYRTGDLGRWRADGRIEHLGRLDSQVKIRGFRIEIGEIEATAAAHEAVRQAVVIAHDVGPSDRRLVAYIVYEPGADLTVGDVRRHLRAKLPEYMVPSLVVAMDAIPLTPNGKVDRSALPDPFGSAAATGSQYEPPSSDMEILLARVWSEVLKLERVGVNDNFFDLGGHSLLSLRVAAEVAARSGWRMDPRTLFFQTLGQIAAAGTRAQVDVAARLTPFFFGSARRRLFGAYEAPSAATANARAVLLCYPWGQEYIRAHRSMRRLARFLTRAGRHVLRFDYFGSGDSMGSSHEVSLRGWEEDIETAIEELRDTCGASRVTLVGLRVGATLAARVAARKKNVVEALILWDPVISGREYVEELLTDAAPAPRQGEAREVRGFPLTHAFADELHGIDLLQLVPTLPASTRVLATAPLSSHERLRMELERQGRLDVKLEQLQALSAWVEYRDVGAGAIPAKVLDTIVQWVRGGWDS